MGSLQILDLVIGVIFIYFLLSIICSSIVEMVNNLSKIRANMLEAWIIDTFNDPEFKNTLGSDLLKTSSIDGLTLKGRKPSYLPSDFFVRSLFDKIVTHHQSTNSLPIKPYDIAELKAAIEKTPLLKNGMKRMLLQNIQDANDDLVKVRKGMEGWFDSAMERLGGTFKKKSQIRLFLIGLSVSIVLNVDTVVLVKYFYQNPEAARHIADIASQSAKDSSLYNQNSAILLSSKSDSTATDTVVANYQEVADNLKRNAVIVDSMRTMITGMSLPMGWQKDAVTQKWIVPQTAGDFFSKFFGILITGFALSMGGVFWFDMLNKLVNLRGSGSKPTTVTERTATEKTEPA